MSMDGRGGYDTFANQIFTSNYIQLTIDHELQSLFLSDYGQRAIYYKKVHPIENRVFETFVEQISKPASMAIVGEDVFWTTTNQSTLYWTPKHTNPGTKTLPINHLLVGPAPETVQLATITPVIKSQHICAAANPAVCSHICVALSGTEHSCLCPDGMCPVDGSLQHCANCEATTTTKMTTTTTTTENVVQAGIESSTETHPDDEHTRASHVVGIVAAVLSLLIVISVAGSFIYKRRFRRSGAHLLVSYS